MKNRASVVVKASKIAFVVFITTFLLSGCTNPSNEDKAKLQEIKKRFGDRYTFEFESDHYFRVCHKKGIKIVDKDIMGIYKIFMYVDFKKQIRRKTSYTEFNVCDYKGVFLYGLFYNKNTRTFEKGGAEHS